MHPHATDAISKASSRVLGLGLRVLGCSAYPEPSKHIMRIPKLNFNMASLSEVSPLRDYLHADI